MLNEFHYIFSMQLTSTPLHVNLTGLRYIFLNYESNNFTRHLSEVTLPYIKIHITAQDVNGLPVHPISFSLQSFNSLVTSIIQAEEDEIGYRTTS